MRILLPTLAAAAITLAANLAVPGKAAAQVVPAHWGYGYGRYYAPPPPRFYGYRPWYPPRHYGPPPWAYAPRGHWYR